MIRERVKTGIEGLDDMLDGGLLTGRPYVVSGPSGTGKTTVCMHFLMEGALNGERVLFVAIDEPPNELKFNSVKFGWDLAGISVLDGTPDILSYDKTPVRDVSSERKVMSLVSVGDAIRRTSEKGPTDVTINTIQELIKQEFKERKYSRMVVDSLTSLKYFYVRTSEEYATLQSFFRTLSDLGVTSMLTVHTPEVPRPCYESQLARGEIRLHKWFDGRGLTRGVTIEKYRGSSHDTRMRHLKITSSGIVVPKSEGGGRRRGKKKAEKKQEKKEDPKPAKGAGEKPAGDAVPPPQGTSEPAPPPPPPPPPNDVPTGGASPSQSQPFKEGAGGPKGTGGGGT
jgi:KaiC/GvpD/RAD55 family RecA-like ATPase